jgi:peptide deformylase
MSILKVARLGHPVLRKQGELLLKGQIRSTEVQQLIDDMFETMHEYEGVGLAAPQVHKSIQLTVIELPATGDQAGQQLTLINPEVTLLGEGRAIGWEGCLSVPDIRGQVPRAVSVRVEALDRHAKRLELEAEGFLARVIQHECDHLNGVLYIDRMIDLKSLSFIREFDRYVGSDEPEV